MDSSTEVTKMETWIESWLSSFKSSPADDTAEVPKMETKNPYDQKASTEAMPIDKDHAIRFLQRSWEHDLTQDQWNEVRPRIVAILQEECQLENWLVGENEVLKTTDMALEALDHEFDMTGKTVKDKMYPKLSEKDRKHIHALEWAVQTLVDHNVLESRIKKIVGAALTCLISKSEWSSSSNCRLGISTLQFPAETGNKILTECLKAYRVLDEVYCWDIEGFRMNDWNLFKMAEGRNFLACFCMIDMQVAPWIEKAEKHLQTLGLGVEGVFLGEKDILSRSDFEKPMAAGQSDEVMWGNFLTVIRSKFPRAINNDDMQPADVGFCTVGGKLLAKLAPRMFLSAQLNKGGCQWQLIGTEYQAVWFTFGTAFVTPLLMDVGLHVLKAFEKCDPAMFPSKLSDEHKLEMVRWMTKKRKTIWDGCNILPIDEDEKEDEQEDEKDNKKKRKYC